MTVLVSLIVLLRLLVPTVFGLHHLTYSRMIFTLVTHTFAKLVCICSCVHAQIYAVVPCHHVLSTVKMTSCLVARRIYTVQCS